MTSLLMCTSCSWNVLKSAAKITMCKLSMLS